MTHDLFLSGLPPHVVELVEALDAWLFDWRNEGYDADCHDEHLRVRVALRAFLIGEATAKEVKS